MRRRYWMLGAAAFAAATLTAAVSAGPAADDISVIVYPSAGHGTTTVTGLDFKIIAEIEGTTGIPRRVTLQLTLPTGLRWGVDAPDPSEGCGEGPPAVCTSEMVLDGAGTARAGWQWDVVAERVGPYEITVTASSAEPDPDTANNRYTLRFEVLAGGGGGGGGGAAVAASAVKLTPRPVRAGSAVTASVRTASGGQPARPTAVKCAGTIGGAKVRAVPKATSGSASCTYRTSHTAKGKTLRGTVSLTLRDERYVRRFAVRLR